MATLTADGERAPRLPLRPLAIPTEHGGWGFVLEPIALGLLVRPSLAGVLLGCAAVAAFLTRHPLKIATRDWTRGRRYERTIACQRLVGIYAATAAIAVAFAIHLASSRLLQPLAIAAPIAIVQFVYDARNRGRDLPPEIMGAAVAGAASAMIALAAGASAMLAYVLWLLTAARSIPAVLFVRAALLGEGRMAAITAHAVAVIVAVTLWSAHAAPATAIVAMALLLFRTLATRKDIRARTIGIRELLFGAATVTLIAAGYR